MYISTVVRGGKEGKRLLAVKGNPRRLVVCSSPPPPSPLLSLPLHSSLRVWSWRRRRSESLFSLSPLLKSWDLPADRREGNTCVVPGLEPTVTSPDRLRQSLDIKFPCLGPKPSRSYVYSHKWNPLTAARLRLFIVLQSIVLEIPLR